MTSKPQARRLPLSRPLLIGGAVLIVAVAALTAWLLRPKGPAEPYRTAQVERGDIVRSVSASGTLQARVTVQVGSQLSGQVQEVLVDFNTPVRKGQVLAIVDPQTFQSRVQQATADLAAQQANLQQQEANLRQAEADLEVQRANYTRSTTLNEKGYLADSGLEQAKAAYEKAQASIGVARAQIGAQRARIAQSRATLAVNQLDVTRTKLLSPIDGVVVSRAVDPGQTVAASLQVSTLFQIAEDLSKLQVKILVDEADIGQVREGQRVNFTVDAFPDETFQGVVTQVRKQPEVQQNVVAYVVIAEADNQGGRLLPGMTANASILLAQERNVLKVSSAALRWRPADQPAPGQRQGQGGGGGGPGVLVMGPGGGGGGGGQAGRQGPGGPGGGGGPGGARVVERLAEELQLDARQRARAETIFAGVREKMQAGGQGDDPQARRRALQEANNQAYDQLAPLLNAEQKTKLAAFRARQAQGGQGGRRIGGGGAAGGMQAGTVWVLDNGKPTPVFVRVGGTDGAMTEIQGQLQPGQEVIIGGGPRAPVQLRPGAPGAGVIPGGGGGQRRIG